MVSKKSKAILSLQTQLEILTTEKQKNINYGRKNNGINKA